MSSPSKLFALYSTRPLLEEPMTTSASLPALGCGTRMPSSVSRAWFEVNLLGSMRKPSAMFTAAGTRVEMFDTVGTASVVSGPPASL